MVFGVCMFNDPFDHVIVWEDNMFGYNGVKSRIPDSLVGQLVIWDIRKVIIIKNCVNSRPFNLVSISDSATGAQQNTKVQVLG